MFGNIDKKSLLALMYDTSTLLKGTKHILLVTKTDVMLVPEQRINPIGFHNLHIILLLHVAELKIYIISYFFGKL